MQLYKFCAASNSPPAGSQYGQQKCSQYPSGEADPMAASTTILPPLSQLLRYCSKNKWIWAEFAKRPPRPSPPPQTNPSFCEGFFGLLFVFFLHGLCEAGFKTLGISLRVMITRDLRWRRIRSSSGYQWVRRSPSLRTTTK